jgi:hypothetical protein
MVLSSHQHNKTCAKEEDNPECSRPDVEQASGRCIQKIQKIVTFQEENLFATLMSSSKMI